MENTPLVLVQEVKELKQLAATLRSVNEFAVDLEHNQYRSFQGMTCLMQISTRTEDFIVDTLKLRVHVGPYLREVFKDPSKRKVMHGADRDIVWLQRDFGIYVCNLFDTHQASRVLGFQKNSLENLLLYFCGVAVNKAYQNADWRVRPLPDDMLKYAREDTHYLLFMYDLMSRRLLSASMSSEAGNDLLLEVYKRSYDKCMQLYEKELLTNTSYLYIYGLQDAGFNSQQLSVVSGLCEWRDAVARAEDESTGYILPNKTLLEIAKQMPLTVSKLRRLVKSKHPYVDVNLDSIVDIIKNSIQNASAFESTAVLLEKRHLETVTGQNVEMVTTLSSQQGIIDDNEVVNRGNGQRTKFSPASVLIKEEYPKLEQDIVECSGSSQGSSFCPFDEVGENMKEQDRHTSNHPRESFSALGQMSGTYTHKGNADSATAFYGATEEVLNKASNDFGLGNSSSKSNLDADPKVIEQHRELDPTVTWPHGIIDAGEGVNIVSGRKTKCLSASLHVKKEVVSAHNIEVSSTASLQPQKNDDGVGVNVNGKTALSAPGHVGEEHPKIEGEVVECSRSSQGSPFQPFGEGEEIYLVRHGHKLDLATESFTILGKIRGPLSDKGNIHSAKALVGVTEETLDKPSHDCELAISIPESNFDAVSNGKMEQMVVIPLQTYSEQLKLVESQHSNNSGRSKLEFLTETVSKLRKCFKKQMSLRHCEEGDEGFKSLLDMREGSNSSSVLSRFRAADQVKRNFQSNIG